MSDYETGMAPVEFTEEVKQALDQLYNFPFLQRLPLAHQLNHAATDTAGKNLRRELIDLIESLNPGNDILFRSPDGRLYNLLNLHYIGRMTIKEVSMELGVSERQAYRDLKRGQVMIAEMLWAKHQDQLPVQHSPLQTELALLKSHIENINLNSLLAQCLQAVERLAEGQQVHLQVAMPTTPLMVASNPPIAQQILINLLSYSIKQTEAATLQVILQTEPPVLQLNYTCSTPHPLNETARQLASQLQWEIIQTYHENIVQITLQMSGQRHYVLVIDDNEGIVELLRRYLAEYPCHILAENTSLAGLEQARQIIPDVIILDVMMPEVDGWEVLQRLRSYPETEHLPIIICSVLHDPELAYSLGASAVITKPITQSNVLTTLRSLHIL